MIYSLNTISNYDKFLCMDGGPDFNITNEISGNKDKYLSNTIISCCIDVMHMEHKQNTIVTY